MALAPGFDPARAWRAGDARLAPTSALAVARALLAAYAPRDAGQAAERARMLAFVDAHPADAHLRERRVGHLTA
ncbi:MAG TPA: hypothetical protein VMT18_00020, partial [Planctomycetota bacterium]|nr:hypothetical protein [Planctomycetota bacterium]